jgi:hypothetical protein
MESTYLPSIGHSMGAGMSAIYTGVFPEKVSSSTQRRISLQMYTYSIKAVIYGLGALDINLIVS